MTFKDKTEVLLDSKSKFNVINQAFALQLGFKIRKTNIKADKIDGTTLKTYGIVVSTFSLLNKDGKVRFFEKSFLLANIKLDIIFEILFLTMSNINIDFKT